MRIQLITILLLSGIGLQAQSYRGIQNTTETVAAVKNATLASRKWFVSKYSGLTTGMSFYNGGMGSFVSAPFGLQLNRPINKNLYAFAGVSVAPTYLHFTQSFIQYNPKGINNGFGRYNQFAILPRAEVGLMYVNDDRTFSISGSIGVQRGYYPASPFQQIQAMQQNPIIRTDH